MRGTKFFDGVPAACFPCGTAIGATFDADLVLKIGHLLGDEAKAKGAHVILGPTINIPRAPLGGRGFESYSEDPFLAGMLAASYCYGVKDKDIVPTLKHFVCNDQEHERMAVNSILTERALREIYLLPFQLAIKASQPGAIMTAYNQVNGVHCPENQHILKDILRDEWKWEGLVMSDWYLLWLKSSRDIQLTYGRFGTYSTSESINAGLDLEMPGPSRWRGAALSHAVTSNKVKSDTLDDRVRALLRLVKLSSRSGVPENAPESKLNRMEDRKLLRKVAADSAVLLKNEDAILPFNSTKRIAVIGPNSKIATISGGGSASLNSYYTVTPYDGIKAQSSAQVDFAQGVYGHQALPQLGSLLKTSQGETGFTMRVYNESPELPERHLIEERRLTDSNVFFLDYNHPKVSTIWYADSEGVFTPETSGIYDFGLCVQGTGRLFINGELIISNVDNQKSGSSFLGAGTIEEVGSKRLEAGEEYTIKVQWGCAKTSKLKAAGVVDFGHGGFSFGGCKRLDPTESLKEAVELAKTVDQVIIIAGLSKEWETEGQDREHMDLPLHTDELITAVLAANSNTAIVLQSGTPVSMPWIDNAKVVVHAWFGGNETGNAIADIVYGTVNPSGKLPITIPRRLQDNPAYLNYRSEGGRVLYGEDVYVGYRYFDKMDLQPLFPFGHGLSYTSFEFSAISISEGAAKFTMTNTGAIAGSEVAQLYIAPVRPRINRPPKELKGFKKVYLEPGESRIVQIDFDFVRSTSFWDEYNEKWCSDKGLYTVLVGNTSGSAGKFLEAELRLEETTFWTGL